MHEPLNQLLAERAAEIVNRSFTGVRESYRWWWERRIGGGVEVCQEVSPEEMAREISARLDRDLAEVRTTVMQELGLDDTEPVVLTFEIPGETTSSEASEMLAERSAEPDGLAAGLYRQVEEALKSE